MKLLGTLYSWIWGPPLLILITGIGLYLTIALRGLQFRYLPYALKLALGRQDVHSGKGDISHFQSLMTSLAATIGIGNIAGVATALTVGGLGALFWMWVTALLGMATKYAESLLAVKYRIVDKNGEMAGGPMYFIERGLKWKWLAVTFAVFGAIAALGGGNMIQANSVADVMRDQFTVDPLLSGCVMAVIVGLTLIGGIKSIGKVVGILVPVMALFYLGGASIILVKMYDKIPAVLAGIFKCAFSGEAACGGAFGMSVMTAMRVGVSRGLMTSEAGLGTGSIAAAAAKTDTPESQALVSMTSSFLATVVMCTVTALVLGTTNIHATDSSLTGAALTKHAFESALSGGGYIVVIATTLFAFTTLLGWAYYGEKCMEYLLGERSIPFYRILFTLIIIPGAIWDLELVWKISDITNALMAYPNLIGILMLSGWIIKETRSYHFKEDMAK